MQWPEISSAVPKAVILAVVAGVMFASGIMVEGSARATGADWLGFAGALLGAALTVAGSVAVLEWQRTREIRARRTLLLELLNDVDAACIPFQSANEPALKSKYGRSVAEQVREVRAAIGRVHAFRKTMAPKTALMMRVADALEDLSFDDEEVISLLRGIRFYPDSADLGGLNALAHQVMGTVGKARALLRP